MVKLFESEIKIMEVLWEKGNLKATDIVREMVKRTNWNKNTTYTVIKKCISKGVIRRDEPGFVCVPLVKKSEIQEYETNELIGRMFGGSISNFISSFFVHSHLSDKEIEEIETMIKQHKSEETK